MGKKPRNSGWNIRLKRSHNSGQIGQAGNNLTQNQNNNYYNNNYTQKSARQWRIPKSLLLFVISEIFVVLAFKAGGGYLATVTYVPLQTLLIMPISGLIVGLIPLMGEFGVLVFMLSSFLFSTAQADFFLLMGLGFALLTGVRVRRSLLS